VRSIIAVGLGGFLGFGATLLAIGAVALFVAGAGGGFLARAEPGMARVLNYDPSDFVLKAAAIGGLALLLLLVFVVIDVRLRARDKRRARSRAVIGDEG
jgi:hypothetical protein